MNMIFPDKAISEENRVRITRAAKLGQLPTLRKIFAPGSTIPIDCHLENEGTPLMVACMNGKSEAAALLLELGADPNAYDDWHLFPLMHAVKHPECVRLLLDAGADVKAESEVTGEQALHCAAALGNLQSISMLLEAGAPLDEADFDHEATPLMRACMAKKPAAALELARRGANVEYEGRHRQTCIDVARKKCGTALADALRSCIGLPAAMAERKAIEAQASPKAPAPRKRAL